MTDWENYAPEKRPTAITVICIIGFIGAGLTALMLLFAWSLLSFRIGAWYPPVLLLSAAAGLASMIGMWMMRKWGLILYTVMFIAGQVMMFATGTWAPMSLIIPIVVIAIGMANVSKMR